jgi:hypothetical protein
MNAFRDGDFNDVGALCLYGETVIAGVAQDDPGPTSRPPIVACIVGRGPGPPDKEPTNDGEASVVAENVDCVAPVYLRAQVRSVLDGLSS